MPGPEETIDCLMVGGGPAGLTAAIYLARYRRKKVVVADNDSSRAFHSSLAQLSGFPDEVQAPICPIACAGMPRVTMLRSGTRILKTCDYKMGSSSRRSASGWHEQHRHLDQAGGTLI